MENQRHIIAAAAVVVVVVLLLVAIPAAAAAQLFPSSSPSVSRPKCDATLWSHIYKPQRLQVLSPCRVASGVVIAVRGERDGDYHILLKPDKRYIGLINPANVQLQNSSLVLEPICSKPITQVSAKLACGGFHQNLIIPYVGEHIRVVGSYVLDHDHSNWAEIHPITSLDVMNFTRG